MGSAKGQMAAAYQTMLVTPQEQLQLLKNHWDTLKTVLGDDIMPVFITLVGWGEKIVGFFENLSPGIQKAIVFAIAIGSVLAVVGGVFLTVAGFALMFIGTLVELAGGVAELEFVIKGLAMGMGPWVLAFMAVVAVVILVIKYHKQLWQIVQEIYHDILLGDQDRHC
jgi:hypothetical protein